MSSDKDGVNEEWDIDRLSSDGTELAGDLESPWTNSYFNRSRYLLYLPPFTFPPVVLLAIKRNVAVGSREILAAMSPLSTISRDRIIQLDRVKCSITPNTGFTLFTTYSVSCDYVKSLVNLEVYQRTSTPRGHQTLLVAYGSLAMAYKMYLAPGDETDHYKSELVIRLIVDNFIHHDIHLSVQVRSYTESELCTRNVELINCLNEHFVTLPRRHLQWLMAKGLVTEAITAWNIIGILMNYNETTELKLEMRDAMSHILYDLPLFETSSVVQIMMAIESMFNSSDSAYSLQLQNRTLETTLYVTDVLYDFCYITEPNYRFVVDAAERSGKAVTAILQATLQQRRWLQDIKTNLSAVFDMRNVTKQGVNSMRLMNLIWHKIGRVLLKIEIAGGPDHVIFTKLFRSGFARVTFDNVNNRSLVFGMTNIQSPLSSYVQLPYNSTQFSTKILDVYLIKYLRHPLAELPSVPYFKSSQAVSVSVYDARTTVQVSLFKPPADVVVHTLSKF
ncbi:hypothetical protein CHUAL_007681 [Chamberlinius hualienensis]